MSVLRLYQDSRGRGTCRTCGAPVEWAQLVSGSRMPFDPPIVVLRTQGDLLGGERIIEEVDSTISKSHFATCKDAAHWRRKKAAR